MRALVVLALACTACVTREIRASPAELEAARALLRDGHRAKVQTLEDGAVAVAPSQRVVIVDRENKRFDLTLAEIVGDCADHPQEENRLCELHGVQHVVLGTDRRVHEAVYLAPLATVVIGSMLGAVIGVSYCAFECDNDYARRASQVGVGAMVGGLLYGLLTHDFRRR